MIKNRLSGYRFTGQIISNPDFLKLSGFVTIKLVHFFDFMKQLLKIKFRYAVLMNIGKGMYKPTKHFHNNKSKLNILLRTSPSGD